MTTPSGEDAPKPRILVVDDSPLDRALASGLLREHLVCVVEEADDGRRALDRIRSSPPDLVLTDVRMPELNGLELVQAVRETHPHVPVVVTTAHGSEELAADALRRGAAHYVPKVHLASRVVETVGDVLVIAREARQRRRLRRCWRRSEFEYCLDNDVSMIPPLVSHLQDSLEQHEDLDAAARMHVGVALHEALRNAVDHGNLELDSSLREQPGDVYYQEGRRRRELAPYAERRVRVLARESPDGSEYVIRDEGPGFDVRSVDSDPTDLANLTRPHGRGLYLIRTFMDEVRHNETGNEVTLVRRRDRSNSNETPICP